MLKTKLTLITLALTLCALTTSASAQALSTDYHDHFHPAAGTPSDIHLQHFTTDSQFIAVTRDDENRFTISDTQSHWANSGVTVVTYGTNDGSRSCTLTIQDGIYMSDPMIQGVDCKGLNYRGMTYDGFGTYQYSISFSYA